METRVRDLINALQRGRRLSDSEKKEVKQMYIDATGNRLNVYCSCLDVYKDALTEIYATIREK